MPEQQWISVARIIRPHGVRGAMKIEILSNNTERLKEKAVVYLKKNKKAILSVIPLNRGAAVELEGITTVEEAETYRNEYLEVPQDLLPDLPKGSFYCFELIGMKALSRQGELLGEVTDASSMPASDVVEIQLMSGKKVMIPLNREVIAKVDKEKREIILSEDLLEEFF